MSAFDDVLLNELADYGTCRTCGRLFYFGELGDLCPNDGDVLQVMHRERVIVEEHRPSAKRYNMGCHCEGCREVNRVRVARQRKQRAQRNVRA
jgi:hypothetical protein